MLHRRHCDGSGVEAQIGVQHLFDGRKHWYAVGRFGFSGAACIGFEGRDEFNAGAGGFEFAVDTKVVAAKGSRPCNRDAYALDTSLGAAVYFAAPLPSTALRHRP